MLPTDVYHENTQWNGLKQLGASLHPGIAISQRQIASCLNPGLLAALVAA